MITNIRPILLTHIVTLIIAADKDAVVTMTVMFRPNDDNKSGKSHSVQITGSHEEIDANMVELIGQAASKITESGNTLAELDAKIADAKKEKEALLKAEKDATAKKKAAPPTQPDDDADEDEGDATVVRKLPVRPKAKPIQTAGLVPALSPQSAATEIGDLGI